MSLILSGVSPREETIRVLSKKIETFSQKPSLAIIQVGNNESSNVYIKQKMLFAEKIGAEVQLFRTAENVKIEEIISIIQKCNQDRKIHGIIVQLPIPKHFDLFRIIEAIDPKKDVDGLTAENVKLLWQGSESGFMPATTRGILELLAYYKIEIEGKRIAMLGRSILVGKPTALALLNKGGTVTLCHSKTEKLAEIMRSADIVISAIGKPHFLTKEFFNDRQIVIDVGITAVLGEKLLEEIPKKKLLGDVDFENVKDIVHAISPVPGGVGLMTVLALFQNLVEACERTK